MKNQKTKSANKKGQAVFLALAAAFCAGAATEPASAGRAACRGSFIGQNDFEKRLLRLSERAEQMFQDASLGGVYFIGKNNLNPREGGYSFVFTPPTAAGEVFLNSSYYERLLEILTPVFRLRSSGVIVADTLSQINRLKKQADMKFPDRKFLIYKSILPLNEKRKILKKAEEGAAYLLVQKDHTGELDFSNIPVYISLARIAENDRIQEIQNFLDSYRGMDIANIFLLTSRKDEKGQEGRRLRLLIESLRESSVNTDLKNKKEETAAEMMSAEQTLAHIQGWGFADLKALKQWHRSFLKPKRLPPRSKEELERLSNLYLFVESKNWEPPPRASLEPAPKRRASSLGRRRPSREIKFRYEEFSEEEMAQIEALIEGSAGLQFTPDEEAVLKLRLFTKNPWNLREVGEKIGVSAATVIQREDMLLERVRTSPLTPPELGARIAALTNKKRHAGSWFRYSDFSDGEKAQISEWASAAKRDLKLTDRKIYLMDHYIFTDNPQSLRAIAKKFGVANSSTLTKEHAAFLQNLMNSEAVPAGLRELIKSRRPKEAEDEDSFFSYKDCSPEEKSLIVFWLSGLKKRMDLTEREVYFIDNHIFSERRNFRRAAEELGIGPTAALYQTRRILSSLLESELTPPEFKDLIRRRTAPLKRKKRFRYSELPAEQKAQAGIMAEAAIKALELDDLSEYILTRGIFTDSPETEQSIEKRFGLKPRTVERRKNWLFGQLQKNPAVPAELRELIRGGPSPAKAKSP